MLIGFWPALALASRRSGAVWLRALALGGATAMISGWLLTQSKGGAIGLIVSTIVVFAVSQRRLRLLLPWAITMAFAAIGAVPLTAPIRNTSSVPALRSAIHHGGTVLLLLTVAGVAVGLLYAFVDRKLEISTSTRKILSRVALVGVVVALVGIPGWYFATVQGPGSFVSNQWHAFKKEPTAETGGTHLLTLGSNRYDFWRVALDEFSGHPLVGIGSRGFGAAYLQAGHSQETPARAHSLPFDALSETGLIGFVLLLLVFAPPIVTVARRARSELTSAGVLAGCVYFAAHACVDWIWTIPAVGVFALLLLSVAAATAPGEARPFSRRTSLAVAGAVLLISLIAFVPSWLAANYAQRAAKGGVGLQGDIDWSKRLDPLSIEPYIAQARWSGSLDNALVPLQQAVELQPRSYAAHYLYGIDLLKVGRLQEAHDQLFRAWQLAPRDPFVNAALRVAPFSRPPR